jgi:biotin transport system substrate-specific component
MKFTTKELVLTALFTALIAVGAFIRVPLPYVPFTLQIMFTTLAGLILGKKFGTISVLLYIIIGLIGIPIFANGGGISYVFQPTFGYIIGFLLGTYITGAIVEKEKNPSIKRLMLASFVGILAVYIIGLIHFYFIRNFYLAKPISLYNVLLYGFLIPVPGNIASCIFGVFIAKRVNIINK